MALMITNALVATKTHLTNGGLYKHMFQEEILFVIHQMEYHHLIHLSNHLDGQYLILQMLSIWYPPIASRICIRRNVQVVLWEIAIPKLY